MFSPMPLPGRSGADVLAVYRSSGPVIVFDLGGTWWRSAILEPDGTLAERQRQAAVTKTRTGSNAATLRELMVQFLLDSARQFAAQHPAVRDVGISLGAAINGHSGQVLASAPMWGDCTDPYDLRAVLASAEPSLQWWIANDVTCLALAICANEQIASRDLQAITAVTVSSGIGSRTIDVRTGEVLLDRRHGMQGEIGHLPALTPAALGVEPPLCDCGAAGHVSAIAAGRSIEAMLSQFAGILDLGDATGDGGCSRLPMLRDAVAADNPAAVSFLDAVTAPLARALLYLLAIDPRVEQVFLSGGVVDTLGDHYMNSLYRRLESDGLYLVSLYQPSIFRDRICRWESDGFEPLRGAGLFAHKQSLQAGDRSR